MKHPIKISVLNDTVGIPVSADGVMCMFVKAATVANKFALDTLYLLTKASDLDALGIDAAYDLANNVAVYQQVSEFYAQAGDGAYLWLVGVAKATNYATYVASDTFAALIRATGAADPLNRAKMLGFCYDVPTATQSSTDFPADVTNTITALETVTGTLFDEGYQFSSIIDGSKMKSTATPATIGTMANKSAHTVSMCITGTKPNGVSAVGLALGRFARISVGHGFGAVEDGPMNTSGAFLTNSVSVDASQALTVGKTYTVFGGSITYDSVVYPEGTTFVCVSGKTSFTTANSAVAVENITPVSGLTPTYIDALGTKQFMFLRTWLNRSGFYWNDGATCEEPEKQLSTQEYNRVANKLSADALAFFIQEMGKNLPLDVNTGAVALPYLNAKQQQFYNEYISPLTVGAGTGDLTDGAIVMTGPNFNSTKTIDFTLSIVPTPILGAVDGIVKFSSTL